jgi:hypothetical protein
VGVLRRICNSVELTVGIAFHDYSPLEGEPPSVDRDVAPKAKEDEGVENEGDAGGEEHPAILESIFFGQVVIGYPAP